VAGTEETEAVGAVAESEEVSADMAEPIDASVSEPVTYTHVDVRL